MVSSYKGAENNEQPKRLLLTFDTSEGLQRVPIIGVFRTETALIDQALRKGTLYRATGNLGDMIAIAPKQIVSIVED
ncbi:hypothetical protein [Limosilactobacillus mucosae]|uniref:hypothetical protein n=1 Tax=Limosilactobacillus mucosae TaxID=97478 RepID=UPI003D09430F